MDWQGLVARKFSKSNITKIVQTKEAESEMTLLHLFISLIIDGSNLGKLDLAVNADGDRQSKSRLERLIRYLYHWTFDERLWGDTS